MNDTELKRPADLVVRAGTVRTLAAQDRPTTAFAVRDGEIVAVAGPGDDDPAAWCGAETVVIDDPGLVVLPAFVDTHNHLMLAARNEFGVPVAGAEDLSEFVRLVADRAAVTPAGRWIVTGANWHEQQLAERRLPTALELDRATTEHPVLVLRGGHNGVLNSVGLRLAGIGSGTPDPSGGLIGRDTQGRPTGLVRDTALELAMTALPPTPPEVLAGGLAQASARYAANGLGTVRDPAVTPQEWPVYREVAAAGRLAVRSHALIFTTPAAIAEAGSVGAYLDGLEAQGITPGTAEGLVRVWGLKFVLDGGVEAAALSEPYPGRPDFRGELMWDRAGLVDGLGTCIRRGWPVGAHAFGDRAVVLVLDAIAEIIERQGPVRPGMVVVEHGGMISPERVSQAAALGVHVTVQQALLTGLAPALVETWGRERAASLFPLRGLLDGGAWISGGTDHPIGPLNPLHGLQGMTTRRTPAGVLGPEHAITRAEAVDLYTTAGARFLGYPHDGALVPGARADFVAYPADPLICPLAELSTLAPALTAVAGRIVHRSSDVG